MSTPTGTKITETMETHWNFIKEQALRAKAACGDVASDWHNEPQEEKLARALTACSELTYAINNYQSLLEAVTEAMANHVVIERKEDVSCESST